MGLAGRASNPHPAMRSHGFSHPPDASMWHADAITDLEWFTLYNVLNSQVHGLEVELLWVELAADPFLHLPVFRVLRVRHRF